VVVLLATEQMNFRMVFLDDEKNDGDEERVRRVRERVLIWTDWLTDMRRKRMSTLKIFQEVVNTWTEEGMVS
jgi:hypothetical protein